MTRFGDWRDTRAAIESAYEAIGEPKPQEIPRREWNLVEAALKADHVSLQRTCIECSKTIPFRSEIVCLDCKCALHTECAPRHFWPNGRRPCSPHSTPHETD